MEISETDKIQILLALLERRYDSIEKIREHVYNISIWMLGVFLAASSFIMQGKIQLNLLEKVFLAMIVVFILMVILLYIKDQERGFSSQFRAAIRIEKLLGFYKPGAFDLEEGLYPAEWAHTGTELGQGRFFRNITLLLCLGTIIPLAAIGLSGLLF